MDEQAITADMRRWLDRAVIGLNLCPFAKAVHVKGQVRMVVATAAEPDTVLEEFQRELAHIVAADPAELDTTLLIIPQGMDDFLSFHALCGRAERLVRKAGLEGVIQVAHFHPRFVFAGANEDDVTNNTNRAPYPTLHLLREASIDRAVAAFPYAAVIYEANMERLRQLGETGWAALDVGPRA